MTGTTERGGGYRQSAVLPDWSGYFKKRRKCCGCICGKHAVHVCGQPTHSFHWRVNRIMALTQIVSYMYVSCHLSGGAMIVLDHLGSKPPTVINFQDAAPAGYVFPAPTNGSSPSTQPQPPVGIPGLLSGLWESHNQFGRLEWAELVQPAIRLALDGIAVSTQLAFAVQSLPEDSPLRRSQSSLFFPNGIPLAEGQVIKQSALADLLKAVALNGVGGKCRF